MACLILRNADGTQEIGRREMLDASERYHIYECCSEQRLFTFGHARYMIASVTWHIPEAECVCRVTFDSWEPTEQPLDC